MDKYDLIDWMGMGTDHTDKRINIMVRCSSVEEAQAVSDEMAVILGVEPLDCKNKYEGYWSLLFITANSINAYGDGFNLDDVIESISVIPADEFFSHIHQDTIDVSVADLI